MLIVVFVFSEMKIAIDDKCKTEFDNIKFHKTLRYITYKVDKGEEEKIVPKEQLRLSRVSERGRKHGLTFWLVSPTKSTATAYSIWSIPLMTACMSASCSSATGHLMLLPSSTACFTPPLKKTSSPTLTYSARKSPSLPKMM